MPATRITLTELGLHCSACGLLEADETETSRHGYNHLLDKHRDELIALHGKHAVERAITG